MDGSRERKKTSVEKRRKNDFKGFEKSISGRKIARRTLHDPYFFRLDRVDELAHYANNTKIDLRGEKLSSQRR